MAVLLRHLDRDFEEVVGRSFLTRDYGAERSRRVRRADARDITFPDLVHAVCGIGKRRRLVISSMRSEQCPIINVKICVCKSLIPHLHLGNSIVESAAPYRNARTGSRGKKAGCQIDLLIQTARTAYVVEIKRQREIGPEIEADVQRKIDNLPLRAGMTPRPVLVYDGHLSPSVEGSGYFDAIIPVGRLLGL